MALHYEFDRETRLRFLGIDETALQALPEIWLALEPRLASLLDDFYRHIVGQPELCKLVGDERSIERLKVAQHKHWAALFSGKLDENYFQRVIQIGQAHYRIGLAPRWYIAGYSFVLSRLPAIMAQHYGGENDKLLNAITIATKVVFLDMELVISLYYETMVADQDAILRQHAATFEATVKGMVDALASSATGMRAAAKTLSATAVDSSKLCAAAAAAAEQATVNVETVAAAAEEMSGSIAEVNMQVQTASTVTVQAVEEANRANERVQGLTTAAEQISDVVSLINAIAKQTNLLALNATIEAARAGEAGRGFAVVASEVKNLATQTAKATEDIATQVEGMQNATKFSGDSIKAMASTVSRVNEIANSIAAAMEQQNAATLEISRNVQEAASGTREVAGSLASVSEGTDRTGTSSRDVLTAADGLFSQSESLRNAVETFLGQIRKAS